MVVGVAGREDRLALAAEKALAQGFVALLRRQQVGAVVIAGRVLVQRLAVGHHRALQLLVEQAQARNQAVDGAQHRAGDVVGIDLVAGHQQHGGAVRGAFAGLQQAVGAEQAIGGRKMRLAAGTVQQVVEPIAQHQAWAPGAGVEQVRRPAGDALAVDEQVIVEQLVAGQRLGEVDVQQVDEGVLAHRDHLAIDLGLACREDEFGLQRLRGDQPDGQALGFQAAQYRAGEYEGQWGRGGHRQL
ncbi:hypothetical protein D3C79_561730 [compost metagenome]